MQRLMKRKLRKICLGLCVLGHLFSVTSVVTGWDDKEQESWMGVYIEGNKVGYSYSQETTVNQGEEILLKSYAESRIKVSRLGGNPIELVTIQESLQAQDETPIETRLRTKMSESETVILAKVEKETIIFELGGEIVKEVPSQEPFYLGVPLEKIIREDGLHPGASFNFKILDPVAYALSDCRFEVIDHEDTLILGEKKRLWHVKSELSSLIPLVVDEWIDENAIVYKSQTQAGFLTTVSVRMDKAKALEESKDNFDIAFSSVIRSNVILDKPLSIQKMTFKLSGLPIEKLGQFPWDEETQKILNKEPDHLMVQTVSRIFHEKDALPIPIQNEAMAESLESTVFCQSDNRDVQELAQKIIGNEKNSWRAAKKIAVWISRNITPNYDVGFASAEEILENLEGDCSEHTVLFVALCRAVGLPARAVVGIMYGDGIFAYHMWPEVYVGAWVGLDAKWLAKDKSSGEYYTDATHIKFGISNLDENMFKDMITTISEIIGSLKLEILDYESVP